MFGLMDELVICVLPPRLLVESNVMTSHLIPLGWRIHHPLTVVIPLPANRRMRMEMN